MVTRYWTGETGTKYEFTLFLKGTEFVPSSGVYVLCNSTTAQSEILYHALYFGEAQSFYQRLNADVIAGRHDGYKRAILQGLSHIGVHFVSGEAERKRIETDLIRHINPICNRQAVSNSLANTSLMKG